MNFIGAKKHTPDSVTSFLAYGVLSFEKKKCDNVLFFMVHKIN